MHTDALDEAFHLLAFGGCLTDVLVASQMCWHTYTPFHNVNGFL